MRIDILLLLLIFAILALAYVLLALPTLVYGPKPSESEGKRLRKAS